MPTCAVLFCRSKSGKENIGNAGISYHRFPKNTPEIAEKWVDFTGKRHWIPTKTSTICSKHFQDNDYLHGFKIKKLKSDAVPTKDHPFQVGKASNSAINNEDLPSSDHTSNIKNQSSRKRKLEAIIETKEYIIKRQRRQIKKIQAQNRRLKKKVYVLEDILNDLKQKFSFHREEISILKNTNLQVEKLLGRYISKEMSKGTKQYSPALRTFALTLHYYSPKAYDYVRNTLNTCFPHVRTLRKCRY